MTLLHLTILVLVAAACGLIAERLVGRALPFGWVGAIVAGFVGAWLMVDVLHLVIAPELTVEGLSLVSAIVGAAIVAIGYSLVSGSRRTWVRRW